MDSPDYSALSKKRPYRLALESFRANRSTALATHSQSSSLHFARSGVSASRTFFAPWLRINARNWCSSSVVIGARSSDEIVGLGFLSPGTRCLLPRFDRLRTSLRERLRKPIIEMVNSTSVASGASSGRPQPVRAAMYDYELRQSG